MSGSAPLTATARIRDIHIDLNDSCNCCCFGRNPRPSTPMYVNSLDVAVKFDPHLTRNEDEALRRALKHLQDIIHHNAKIKNRDNQEALGKIENLIGTRLNPEQPQIITYDLILRLNAAIKEIFEREE